MHAASNAIGNVAKTDGADTQFSLLHGEFAGTPLAKYLGVLKAGSYQQAHPDKSWAYDAFQSMWTEDIDSDDDDPLLKTKSTELTFSTQTTMTTTKDD